eukprot:5915106-Amphidinium_carterae.1
MAGAQDLCLHGPWPWSHLQLTLQSLPVLARSQQPVPLAITHHAYASQHEMWSPLQRTLLLMWPIARRSTRLTPTQGSGNTIQTERLHTLYTAEIFLMSLYEVERLLVYCSNFNGIVNTCSRFDQSVPLLTSATTALKTQQAQLLRSLFCWVR